MREQLLKELRMLRDEGPEEPRSGICPNLKTLWIGEVKSLLLRKLFREWPEFSGDPNYPVPFAEHTGFSAYYAVKNKWTGKYGAARIRLLNWMIETLENEHEND